MKTRTLFSVLGLAVSAAVISGGCSSDKSFALVSVLSSGGQLNDVAQVLVDVRNDPHTDALAYPKVRKDPPSLYRFDEAQSLTFSIGYRNSTHAGTLLLGVTVLDKNGALIGYGEGSATIVADKITEVTVRVTKGAMAPTRVDGGSTDANADGSVDARTSPADAGPACDPAAPTVCAGGTCYVACRPDDTAVGMCTMAGTKNHGELCTRNEDCVLGAQCFEYACGAGKPGIKACMRFCKDDGQCASGHCSNQVPCGGKPTEFKTCSQACNPVGAATEGCAAGLNCFLFVNEIADCDCAGPDRSRADGATCTDSNQCQPGMACVKMSGAMTCRPLCRLDAPTTCAAGRTCTRLTEPDYKTYGACLP